MSDLWFKRIVELLEEIRDRLPETAPPKPVGYQSQNQCRHCGTMFIAGTGTGRRLDAAFCCDEHRTRHNSLRRSPNARKREEKSTDNRQ